MGAPADNRSDHKANEIDDKAVDIQAVKTANSHPLCQNKVPLVSCFNTSILTPLTGLPSNSSIKAAYSRAYVGDNS